MDGPLVSVIIPVYNVEHYVKKAIDSVICQTYDKLEIIIVDDGSTDTSGSICDEYKFDHRVNVIHQKNSGLCAARNSGLKNMTGEVVAFLDSDDYFFPEMISRMVSVMENHNADIVICDFKWDDHVSGIERKSLDTIGALKELISGKMELASWNKIYRRNIWDGFRFPEGQIYEGTRTTFKLLEKAKRIEQIPDCLLYHRTRQGSIVKTKTKENSLSFFDANYEFELFVIEHTPFIFSETERDKFLCWRFNQKIPYWAIIRKEDPILANNIRLSIIEQVKDKKLWGKKTKMKYTLLKYCPRLLPIVLKAMGIEL